MSMSAASITQNQSQSLTAHAIVYPNSIVECHRTETGVDREALPNIRQIASERTKVLAAMAVHVPLVQFSLTFPHPFSKIDIPPVA